MFYMYIFPPHVSDCVYQHCEISLESISNIRGVPAKPCAAWSTFLGFSKDSVMSMLSLSSLSRWEFSSQFKAGKGQSEDLSSAGQMLMPQEQSYFSTLCLTDSRALSTSALAAQGDMWRWWLLSNHQPQRCHPADKEQSQGWNSKWPGTFMGLLSERRPAKSSHPRAWRTFGLYFRWCHILEAASSHSILPS